MDQDQDQGQDQDQDQDQDQYYYQYYYYYHYHYYYYYYYYYQFALPPIRTLGQKPEAPPGTKSNRLFHSFIEISVQTFLDCAGLWQAIDELVRVPVPYKAAKPWCGLGCLCQVFCNVLIMTVQRIVPSCFATFYEYHPFVGS